jgi:RHS repeat-associated protein
MNQGENCGLVGYMPLAVAANDNQGVSQLAYVHANHMGVPIRYSNASGTTLAAPTSYSIPGFPGQSRTLGLGSADLYCNRYRDYDTSTGRYIQADPIGLAGGASPYSYAMNSPLRYTDPTGEVVPLVLCGVGGLAGAAGTALGDVLSGNGLSWKHTVIGAGAGCVAGLAAPVVATSAAGAIALGAVTNVGQYAATQYFDDKCITAQGLAVNAALGGIAGKFAGPFTPRGMQYSADVLPWMASGSRDLFRRMNQRRIEDAARRGFGGAVASGASTTLLGSPF